MAVVHVGNVWTDSASSQKSFQSIHQACPSLGLGPDPNATSFAMAWPLRTLLAPSPTQHYSTYVSCQSGHLFSRNTNTFQKTYPGVELSHQVCLNTLALFHVYSKNGACVWAFSNFILSICFLFFFSHSWRDVRMQLWNFGKEQTKSMDILEFEKAIVKEKRQCKGINSNWQGIKQNNQRKSRRSKTTDTCWGQGTA